MKSTENLAAPGAQHTGIYGNLPFEIHSLHELQENDDYTFIHPHNNKTFEIIWLIKGTGIHYIDLQKSTVENNNLLFIKPGQVHCLNLNGASEGYVISFTEPFLSIEGQESNSTYHTSLFNMFASSDAIPIDKDALPDMKNILDKMIIEFNCDNLLRGEIIRRYFKILLIYITRQVEGGIEFTRPTRNIEMVQQFMGLLEKNYKEQKMVSDYACMLSVTPNYLNEIIKKTTGFSAGHHIRQRIALEAKRQATYSGQCMKEIAYFLGFCDMAHFSKFFKNTTGMNFSEFKKEKRLITASALVN